MTNQKTIIEQNIKTELPVEDSPAVVAYRVGRLEEAVEKGFSHVNEKLDELSGFMTEEDANKLVDDTVKRERERSDAIHEDHESRISKLESFKGGVITTIAKYAVTAMALMLLSLYGLDSLGII